MHDCGQCGQPLTSDHNCNGYVASAQKPMNTWEDRFDDMAEELCVWFDSDGEDETNVYLNQLYELDEIKAFIRSELQQQRREIELRKKQIKKRMEMEMSRGERFGDKYIQGKAIGLRYALDYLDGKFDDIIKKVEK